MSDLVLSREISAGGSKELLNKLKELLKTEDSAVLRGHILQLAKAWGLKIRLPKSNAA
jgi:hypothetical protein